MDSDLDAMFQQAPAAPVHDTEYDD